MNVWENIALPIYIQGKKDREVEERVTDLLNLVNLADKALFFPRQLSGGEAQRVSIARALACGPKIIFADEPTGNLDTQATLAITRLLKKINELGTTVLFATHDELVLKELAKEKIVKLEKKTAQPEETNEEEAEQVKEIAHFEIADIKDEEEAEQVKEENKEKEESKEKKKKDIKIRKSKKDKK